MCIGPGISREFVQPVHVAVKRAIGEKTERPGNLNRVVESLPFDIRLPNKCHPGHVAAVELAFHCRERDRLIGADDLGLLVAGGKGDQQEKNQAGQRARPPNKVWTGPDAARAGVKRTQRGNDERSGHDRRALVMSKLDHRPRIREVGSQTLHANGSIRLELITDGMLHEGVCNENEIAGQPAPGRNKNGREKMDPRAEPLLPPDQRTDKGAFHEKGEHTFHRQGLPDHAAEYLEKPAQLVRIETPSECR